MDALTLASRAVIAEYASRTTRPIIRVGVGLLVIGLIGSAYLIATVSGWWWLLMLAVLAYGALGSILWLVIRFTLGRIKPPQTVTQTEAVGVFVERIESLQDTMGMTRFGLLLRIIRDVSQRREHTTVTKFVGDSKGLKTDFEAVIRAFR